MATKPLRRATRIGRAPSEAKGADAGEPHRGAAAEREDRADLRDPLVVAGGGEREHAARPGLGRDQLPRFPGDRNAERRKRDRADRGGGGPPPTTTLRLDSFVIALFIDRSP